MVSAILESADGQGSHTAPLRPLRILIALETSGGGSGRHALDLAEGLDALGHAVVIVYSPIRAEPSFLNRLNRLPVLAISVPMERSVGLKDIRSLRGIARVIADYGPFDILHAHSSKAGALLRALPCSGAKIYTPHAFKTMDPGAGRFSGVLVGSIEATLARLATDRLIAVSTEEAEHARAILRVPRERITKIVNGVEAQNFRTRNDVRAELGLGAEEVLIGFVGRMTWQKHPQLFLDSIARVRTKFPHVRGLMLGDGDLLPDIVERRAALGLENVVDVLSGKSALAYFSGMDCLAMTSRYEAMPYVMLEALSAGLPLISTAVGGAEEAIAHGVNGFIAEAAPEPFAEALMMVVNDDLLRRRFSAASSERAKQYSIATMVTQTVAVYSEALNLRIGGDRHLGALRAAA